MPGPLPKPAHLRQRQNKKTTKATLETPDKPIESTNLPDLSGHEWHPLTVAWWDHVWASPMAAEYLQTDVDALGRVAMLVDSFYHKPNANVMKEIRLQEARFGLSPIDRSRLQWEVAKGEEAERKRKPLPSNSTKSAKDPRGILGVVK